MRIVATSDTHFPFDASKIPDGDVFILAGDLMYYGDPAEWHPRLECLAALPHKHKIYVPGNHDYYARGYRGIARSSLRREAKTILLDDMDPSISIDGIEFYGLPFVTGLRGWAYNVEEEWLEQYMANIEAPHVLISHSPPYKIRDKVGQLQHYGALTYNRWFYAQDIKPDHWICGHIHESYGSEKIEGCQFHNVAMCDEKYEQVNPPIVIDL